MTIENRDIAAKNQRELHPIGWEPSDAGFPITERNKAKPLQFHIDLILGQKTLLFVV